MKNHLEIMNRLLDVRKELKRLHDIWLHEEKPSSNAGLRRDHYLRLDTMVAAVAEVIEDAHIGARRFSERQQQMTKVVVFDDEDTYSTLDGCLLILFDKDFYLGEGNEQMSWKDVVHSKLGTVDCISLDKIVDEWDNGG